jgi:hypothetical protein
MDNDLDILQKKWKAADVSAKHTEQESLAFVKMRAQRGHSLLQKLQRAYRVPLIIGLLLPVFAVTCLDVFEPSVLLRVCYGAFGLIMAAVSWCIIRRLRRCNFSQMTVRQAVDTINSIYWFHLVSLCMGWILCIPILVLIFVETMQKCDVYILYGVIVGIILGLPIGIQRDVKIYRYFKSLRQIFNN